MKSVGRSATQGEFGADVIDTDPADEWRTHLKNAVEANRRQSIKRLKEALEVVSTLPGGANAQLDTLAPQLASRIRHAAVVAARQKGA